MKQMTQTEKTKSYSWDVPLKFYNPEVFKNDWRKVADHTRSVLMEDLVNPSDYKSIDIDAESGRLYVHVRGVKPKHWNYFENERGVEGEED